VCTKVAGCAIATPAMIVHLFILYHWMLSHNIHGVIKYFTVKSVKFALLVKMAEYFIAYMGIAGHELESAIQLFRIPMDKSQNKSQNRCIILRLRSTRILRVENREPRGLPRWSLLPPPPPPPPTSRVEAVRVFKLILHNRARRTG